MMLPVQPASSVESPCQETYHSEYKQNKGSSILPIAAGRGWCGWRRWPIAAGYADADEPAIRPEAR